MSSRKRHIDSFPQADPKEIERIMNEPSPFAPPALVGMVDGRCFCDKCEARTTSIYRMIGHCWNCKVEPILMLFRAGDKATDLDCPVCGVYRQVHPLRLATAAEIPAAVVDRDR